MKRFRIQRTDTSTKKRVAQMSVVPAMLLLLLAGLLATSGAGLSATGSNAPNDQQSAETTVEWQAVIDAAKKEGVVVWYTAITWYAPIAQAFKDKYGINVQISRQSSGPLTRLFLTQAQAHAGVADVMQAFDPPPYTKAADAGYFKELTTGFLPALANVRKDLVSKYYTTSNTYARALAYNSDLVKNPPKTWKDLLDPAYKDQIIIVDPTLGGVAGGLVNLWYDKYGEDFLVQMGKQNLTAVASAVPGLNQLAAGEAKILVGTNHGDEADLVAKGAPIKIVVPDDTVFFGHDLAVSATAPHPNAARLFANFLLTNPIQIMLAKAGPTVLVNVVAPNGLKMLPSYVPVNSAETDARAKLFGKLLRIGS